MPIVNCDVYDCDYNNDGCCNAKEIKIDDSGECYTIGEIKAIQVAHAIESMTKRHIEWLKQKEQ